MGGGGGRGPDSKDLDFLESLARRSLREGSQPTKRNVFISFVQEDLDEVNLLRGQAKNENSKIEFNDWSLREPFDSKKADYIKRGIRERIKQSSVTVVYLSNRTANSKWVDWEIRESIKLGKGVLGVYKGSSKPRSLPPAINEHGIQLVPWKGQKIAEAIESATKES